MNLNNNNLTHGVFLCLGIYSLYSVANSYLTNNSTTNDSKKSSDELTNEVDIKMSDEKKSDEIEILTKKYNELLSDCDAIKSQIFIINNIINNELNEIKCAASGSGKLDANLDANLEGNLELEQKEREQMYSEDVRTMSNFDYDCVDYSKIFNVEINDTPTNSTTQTKKRGNSITELTKLLFS